MSVQFARWNLDGRPPRPEYIEKVRAALAPFGPDSNGTYSKGAVTILYYGLHTTKESHREVQPHIGRSGAVITWDGVLDNRRELISELSASLPADSPDVTIVAAAYEKWGDECLAKMIGDWTLSIWNPGDQSLLLARDPIGTRHLYYTFDKDHVAWCTILDPLVRFAGKTLEICEEYIAGWFVPPVFPAPHLTPHAEIQDVPPSSHVQLRSGKHGLRHVVSKYWDFDPGKKIRYRKDAEYEEHFRSVFAQAVQRKLRSDRPVLAELSGGMDSSSIVCMADAIVARGQADCPCLDTLSWYDDTYDHLEPDTNELQWIRKVEEKRGKAGYHINSREIDAIEETCPPTPHALQFDNERFAAVPVPNNPSSSEFFKRCKAHIESRGYRVLLSGIGGDETTGAGVPSPTQEFQNLLARGRLLTLYRQLNLWAARMKSPRLPLLWDALSGFLSKPTEDMFEQACKTPWLTPAFVRRNRSALTGYLSRTKFFGPLPSFQCHIDELERGRRLFGARGGPSPELYIEYRYPFTDRDFREFVYAIPREQIVGVGKRRYLLKRALAGIVPEEIFSRRRKSFVPPETARTSKANKWPSQVEIGESVIAGSTGIVIADRFLEALEKARKDQPVPLMELDRTLTLEFWLRHLAAHGVLATPPAPRATLRAKREVRSSILGSQRAPDSRQI